LHRLVYVSAALGVVHYWWLVKADVSRPLAYGTILAVLLGARLAYRFLAAPAAGRRLVQPRPRSA
jgi:sulfoxide reductase heme-binding subunit YedZ